MVRAHFSPQTFFMLIDIVDTPEKVLKSITNTPYGISAINEYANHFLISTVEDLFLDRDVYEHRIFRSTQGHDHQGKGQLNLIHINDVLAINRSNTLRIIQNIYDGR